MAYFLNVTVYYLRAHNQTCDGVIWKINAMSGPEKYYDKLHVETKCRYILYNIY